MTEECDGIEGTSLSEVITSDLKELIRQVDSDRRQKIALKKYLLQVQKAFQKDCAEDLSKLLSSRNKDQLTMHYPVTREIFERLSVYAKRKFERFFISFFNRFEAYCQENKFSLRGRMPNLIIDDLLEVKFDESKSTVKIGVTFIKTLEWEKIRSVVDHEIARIWKREFNPTVYRDLLIKIYTDVMKIKPNPVGWVRLEDVYQAIKSHIVKENPNWKQGGRLSAYYKDEFSADLSKFWAAQASGKINPPYFEFSAIRDPRLSYKIILPDRQKLSYGHLRPAKGGTQ